VRLIAAEDQSPGFYDRLSFHASGRLLPGTGERKRIAGKTEIFDHSATDDVLLDNALGIFGSDITVPRAFGIDERDRAGRADSQAPTVRPVGGAVRAAQSEGLEPLLEVFPRGLALLGRHTVRTGAQEDVPFDAADAEGGRGGLGSCAMLRHAHAATCPVRRRPILSHHSCPVSN